MTETTEPDAVPEGDEQPASPSADPLDLFPQGPEERIARKEYYSIGEVCDLTDLKPHVLRYWESQFDALRPNKNRAGNRVFRTKDIELIVLVKRFLYEQKYTIEGARQKLDDMRRSGELEEMRREALTPELLAAIRTELRDLLALLAVPESAAGEA